MWLMILLAVYLASNLYIYFRIRTLFFEGRSKKLFTLFYAAFALAFPFTEMLSHMSGLAWTRYLALFGYCSLPYLLYLFLAVVIFDILIGAGRLLKIVSGETVRGRCFRLIGLLALAALPLAVVIAGSVNYSAIKINTYHIAVARKSSAIDHVRIALAADFHLREMTGKGFMAEFVEKMNSLHPDIVLIPGDVLEGDREDEATMEYERQFRRITSTYGVYASFGNHESHGGYGKLKFFSGAGIRVLQDAVVKIDEAFYVVGRNDSHGGKRKTMAELMKQTAGNLPVIVLDHRPVDLEAASRSGVDIQVSGHTHGGQLFPLNYVTGHLYDLTWGHEKIRHTHFFVTSGIQAWGPPVRTAGDSEIVLIEVDFVND